MYFLNAHHREQAEQIEVTLAGVRLRTSGSEVRHVSSDRPEMFVSLHKFCNYLRGATLGAWARFGCRDPMAGMVHSYVQSHKSSPLLFGHSLTIAGSNLMLDLDEAVLRINSLFHTPTAPGFNGTFFFLKTEESKRGVTIGLFSQSSDLTYGQVMGVSALIRNYLIFLATTALRVPKTHQFYGPINFNSDRAVLQKLPEKFTQVPVSVLFRTITNNSATRLPSVTQQRWLHEYMEIRTPPTTLSQLQSDLSTCPKHGITYGNNLAKYEYTHLYRNWHTMQLPLRDTRAQKKLYDAFLREVQRKCRNAIRT